MIWGNKQAKNSLILLSTISIMTIGAFDCVADIDSYAGWFLGAGFGLRNTENKITLDDNASVFVGYNFSDASNQKLISSKVNKSHATISAGYGNFIIGNCYLGGELSFDFGAGNNTKILEGLNKGANGSAYGTTTLKTKDCMTTYTIKLGSYISPIDALLFLKGGFSLMESQCGCVALKDQIVKNRGIAPILGIGIEKNIFDRFSLKIDGDYRFFKEKKSGVLQGYYDNGADVPNYHLSLKNKLHGYMFHVTLVYHF